MAIKEAIARLVDGEDLTEQEAAAAMQDVVDGAATPAQIGAFATALRMKGETAEELAGLTRTMRRAAVPVEIDGEVVDTAGTGGDGRGTFNISTVAAIVAAGGGARVAKHGNRAASSACGSADLLEALGVAISLPPAGVATCVHEVGIGFMFAPLFHPALRHAIGPRREIGIRTVFNVLGPLLNPAGARAQILGVSVPSLAGTMAEVLLRTGSRHALVVYGEDGVDELSLCGPSHVYEVVGGAVREYRLVPEELGLRPVAREALASHSVEASVELARSVLAGDPGPARDVVLLNAAGTLLAADVAGDLGEGLQAAAASIDSGAARRSLEQLCALSQRLSADLARGGLVSDFLARIAAYKRDEVERRQAARPLADVRAAALAASMPRDFGAAIAGAPPRIIAEVKRVSPAKGPLNPSLRAGDLARSYAEAGAHALSVLTDEAFFHGSDADLVEARAVVSLPVLRKDFVLSPYQVYEARALGADAVLLIAAMLAPAELRELHALAMSLQLAALVEIHAEDEVAAALGAGATLVGVNNRNLATFEVDLATTENVCPRLPAGVTVVSESGIATAADVRRVVKAGATAILVGEALVTAGDPAARMAELLGAVAWSR